MSLAPSASRGAAALLLGATLAWAAAVLAAPVAAAGHPRAPSFRTAGAVYAAAGLICHQRADRSFRLQGTRLPVCGRCTGLYLGAPVGAALALLVGAPRLRRPAAGTQPGRIRHARRLLALAAAPTALSVVAEWSGAAAPGSMARALAAVPLGLAVAWVAGAGLRGELR